MNPTQRPTPDQSAALARKLIHQLAATVVTGSGSEEVLFDCTIDGVRYRLLGTRDAEPAPSILALSPRELQIARMVSLGHTTKTIADLLDISLWTVATHLRRAFAKLGVSTRAAMIGALSGDQELSGASRAAAIRRAPNGVSAR